MKLPLWWFWRYNRDVVIVDDICDTGGTLAKSAFMLKEKGGAKCRTYCTHPVLSGNAYENIDKSVLEELVVCRNTIPIKDLSKKIKVISTDELFAITIRNAFENKSINSLFMRSRMANRK